MRESNIELMRIVSMVLIISVCMERLPLRRSKNREKAEVLMRFSPFLDILYKYFHQKWR